MTRTERAAFPRAVNKDRSVARNGMNRSMVKGGAAGGWGTIQDEIAGQQDDYNDNEGRDEFADNMTTSSGMSDARKSPEMPRQPMRSSTEKPIYQRLHALRAQYRLPLQPLLCPSSPTPITSKPLI
ncbi:hypothetical protein OPQ81_003745 [Rhizoctonia solani]|nr:hypothetical protein OPQ81_003745 [Rhizoctonia solani]